MNKKLFYTLLLILAIDILCTAVILRYVIIDEGNIFIRLAWASDIMLCGMIGMMGARKVIGIVKAL